MNPSRYTKSAFRRFTANALPMALAAGFLASQSAQAATITKANTSNLNTGADWTGGIAPGAFDIASFTNTISSGNESALTLGANLAWKGLQVGTVNGPITITNTGGFTLTVGTSGIDMSAASNNLTINSNLTLRGAQSWSAASGKTLTVSGGTFTHTGATVDFTSFNSGATLSGITNDASGILGPWATTGTGTSLNYAANTAGSVAAATTNTTTLPVTGATLATNYTMTANTTMTTAAQSANTLRITGGTTLANGGFDLALNGLMNAGTATNPFFSGAGKLLIGTSSAAGTNELVITAATTAMQISSVIANNGSSTGVLTLSTIGTPTGSNGRVIVSGANTYTGGTYINGNVQLNGNVANPLGTGTVTLAGGWLENGVTINSGNLANSIVLAAGTTSNISLNGTFNFFVSGPLSGSGNLILGNQGNLSSLVLNGNNSGLTGTITIANQPTGNVVQLGNGAITNTIGSNVGSASAAWVFNNTGSNKTMFGATTSGTYEFGSFTGNGRLANNGGGGAGITATVQVGALNLNDTFSGVLDNATGVLAFTKVGAGTQTLSGANTYAGATTVNAGTLVAANAAALGSNAAGTTVASGATLDVQANIGTEAISLAGTGVGGNGALITSTGTGTVGGAVTLTADSNIGGAGTLNVTGAIGGATFGINKVGAGTTTLSNTNTYTGVTSVTGGTLALGVANSINSASNISLTAATLATGGFADTVGTLTINTGVSIMDLGAAGASTTFSFANSSALTWNGTLKIYNWTAGIDHVIFGSNASGLAGSQLSAITFYSDAGTTLLGGAGIDGFGEISAIPEPSTYGMAFAGFLTILVFTRKRSQARHRPGF